VYKRQAVTRCYNLFQYAAITEFLAFHGGKDMAFLPIRTVMEELNSLAREFQDSL